MATYATWLNTVTLPEFSDLVMKQFSHVSQMVAPRAAQLFIQEDLTGWGSETKRYDEVDVDTYAKLKRQGENSQKGRVGIGYNKTMRSRRYALEINVSWEYRRFAQQWATQVASEVKRMNHYIPQRFDLNLSHVLAFATATSFTDMDGETIDNSTGDGLAILSSVHTLAHTSQTYRNRVAGDPAFSQGGLDAAESLFVSDILSNFGETRVLEHNIIFSTNDPTTRKNIAQVLKSMSDPDSANSGVSNMNFNAYQQVVLPMLATTATGARDATKKRWWGIVAQHDDPARSWQAYYGVFEQANMKTPSAGNNGEDFSNDDWKYGVRGSMGVATLSGRGLVMSCPTN